MYKLFYLLFQIVFVCGLCGCGIGACFVYSNTVTIDYPRVYEKRIEETKSSDQRMKTEELISWWGKPNEKEIMGERKEKWTYYFRMKYGGVLVWCTFIPIPLAIAIGYEYVVFDVENNNVKSAIVSVRGKNGFFIGLWPTPDGFRSDLHPFSIKRPLWEDHELGYIIRSIKRE